MANKRILCMVEMKMTLKKKKRKPGILDLTISLFETRQLLDGNSSAKPLVFGVVL